MNRPGMNGYRTPASKKAKREEAKVSDEANDLSFRANPSRLKRKP